MTDDDAFLAIFLGAAAGVVGAYAFVVLAIAAWEGLGWLAWQIRAIIAQRRARRLAAVRAVAAAAHRAWFVKEMRANPNAFGGDHKPSEFREGE